MSWPKGKPRPPGAGRKPGTPNKATVKKAAEVAASGLTPLAYLLSVLRNEDVNLIGRIDAAKAAAPYVHPRLANIELTGANGGAIEIRSAANDEGL